MLWTEIHRTVFLSTTLLYPSCISSTNTFFDMFLHFVRIVGLGEGSNARDWWSVLPHSEIPNFAVFFRHFRLENMMYDFLYFGTPKFSSPGVVVFPLDKRFFRHPPIIISHKLFTESNVRAWKTKGKPRGKLLKRRWAWRTRTAKRLALNWCWRWLPRLKATIIVS